MRFIATAAAASLLLVQASGALAQTGTAAGVDGASGHSKSNLYGGVLVGGILIAVAAVAATGGNDGLADTSKAGPPPVIVPPVTTATTTATSTN